MEAAERIDGNDVGQADHLCVLVHGQVPSLSTNARTND